VTGWSKKAEGEAGGGQKPGTPRSSTPRQKQIRSRHDGERKTASFWDDSTWWPSHVEGLTLVIRLLDNVKQKTIEPFIKDTIESGTLVDTDEYRIDARLKQWGYAHKRVNHGRGKYARDEDGDGFCEVHINTMEGFGSLLRSWLRPHRGISQEKLPLYLGFFEFVHNVRRRGKALLGSLIEQLLSKDPETQ
jgi:transposase